MKSPLPKALVCGLATYLIFAILVPSLAQLWLPASSHVSLQPNPPNQIKSIQLSPTSARGFYPPLLIPSLQPKIVRVQINGFSRANESPVLFVNLKDVTMEVNMEHVASARGVYDQPFTEAALDKVFAPFRESTAPRGPVPGPINVKEVYQAIAAVGASDIFSADIPPLNELSSYKISYIQPFRRNWISLINPLLIALLATVGVFLESKRKAAAARPAVTAEP